jgi:hypothetical protein
LEKDVVLLGKNRPQEMGWMRKGKEVGSQKKDGLYRGTFALQQAATKDLGQFTL